MMSFESPKITPPHIRARLREGKLVHLEEPGWADNRPARCPLCGAACRQFTVEPGLLYHYGETVAYRHVCGVSAEPRVVPRVIAEEYARQVWDHQGRLGDELQAERLSVEGVRR